MSGCDWRKNVPNLISSCMNLMVSLIYVGFDDQYFVKL